MSSPSFLKLGPGTPENGKPFGKSSPLPKIARRKRAKSSITQLWIIRFRSNFIQNLHTWHPKCCKCSRSRGQRSRSQRDVMCANKISKLAIIVGDCLISLKFRTYSDHVTLVVPQTFKVNGSKIKVTARHNVLASKTL